MIGWMIGDDRVDDRVDDHRGMMGRITGTMIIGVLTHGARHNRGRLLQPEHRRCRRRCRCRRRLRPCTGVSPSVHGVDGLGESGRGFAILLYDCSRSGGGAANGVAPSPSPRHSSSGWRTSVRTGAGSSPPTTWQKKGTVCVGLKGFDVKKFSKSIVDRRWVLFGLSPHLQNGYCYIFTSQIRRGGLFENRNF